MLHKTQGIVLSTLNYNDKYILVQVYTDTLGRVTYMVSKAQSKTSRVPKVLFQPLSILELEVDHQPSRDIQRVREAQRAVVFEAIPLDMVKTSMAFFLSEFLTKTLKDTEPNKNLFEFIKYAILILENAEHSIANFHMVFMLRMSHFLGFYPNLEEYKVGSLFDMLNGEFVQSQPLHRHYVTRSESEALSRLGRISFTNMHLFQFSRQDRINILNRILEYYRIHLTDFPPLKSLDVLHELF